MKKQLSALALLLVVTPLAAEVAVRSPQLSIEVEELELAARHVLPAAQQQAVAKNPDSLRRFVRDYAGLKQMASEARARGLDTKPEIAIRLQHQANQLLTRALIEDELAREAMPDLTKVAEEAYLLEPQRFELPEQVRAQHILLSAGEEESDEQLRQRAAELLATLRKDSSRFAELAREHSDDPSAAQNAGDLGFFAREQMVKPFADAAFALKKGAISEPVKTRFGYHIIQLLERKPAAKQSFAEVKEQLLAEAEASYRNKRRQEVVAGLRGTDEPQLDEAAIDRLQELLQAK